MNVLNVQDSSLVRCDILDTGPAWDKDMMGPAFYPEGEPSPTELAQCEAEVGTLLSIIAEVNRKMGSLKPPSWKKINQSLSIFCINPALPTGGSGVVWTKLQEALTAVEDSISCRRSWATPITSSDQEKHREHLRAAQDSRVKAAQILEEMEKEFGIKCPPGLPKAEYQEEMVNEKLDCVLRRASNSHQGELEAAKGSHIEEETNKLVGHHRAWRSGSCSPSYRPSGAPEWSSPSFPGSPLLLRRAAASLSVGGDGSPLSSVNSGSPCPSPISLETETERLHRCIERLRARNERLTAALERRKGESEQMSVTVKRLEADCSTLQLALKYCEQCQEAYSELLSLYDAERHQSIPPPADAAEAVGGEQQAGGPSAQLRKTAAEELSTSFSHPESTGREVALREQIERLKRERAAICLPKPGAGAEGNMSPDTRTPAGLRGGHVPKDSRKPADGKKEKTSLFHELVSVREEMSDLRALIRLKEKELRRLEWSLMSQKAQEAVGVFVPESLREELDDCKTEQQNAAKLCGDGGVADLRSRPILKELQAVLQREQALKKRLAVVQDSLSSALSDSVSNRRDNEEQVARLTQAHSMALSSYRHIRRKYREQVWRLEQKLAAVMEGQHSQSAAATAAGDVLEWRREETVL
ncbi:colorectal mutant cancer protein-like [Lampetra planeri]